MPSLLIPFTLLMLLVPEQPEKADLDIRMQVALLKGAAHLRATQNEDGSWGSPASGRVFTILATVPGSHKAFKVAVTGLCTQALYQLPRQEGDPPFEEAVQKGLNYLIEHVRVKRPNNAELYNVWAFGYGMECLATLLPAIEDPETKARASQAIEDLLEILAVYQVTDGGWGYFDFDYGRRRPAGTSMSFTTATILVAMKRAQEAGIEIPEKMLGKALRILRSNRKADGSYIYGEYLKYTPNHPVNKLKGSISRTPACHLSLYYFDQGVTVEDLTQSLEALLKHQHFADLARKLPMPHESWYSASGYFYLYGQYYSALVMKELPAEDRERLIPPFADILLKLQDPDGAWWDFPFYGYHKPYGTAYSLMSLTYYLQED